jgi:solute carrier family 25 protein 46
VLSKFTPWPKEINSRTTVKQFAHHLLLKSISLAVVLPFYAASLVETVQSDIASEKPGILDVFKEGSSRLLAWSAPAKGRMLPVWALLGPAVSFGLTKYLFSVIVKGVSTRIISRQIHKREEKKGARSKDLTTINNEIELYSNIISLISSEILFFPFETILHRMQLQGTRTIIDNLDSGIQVVPILTSYEGAIDCYMNTVSTEGFGGLYKGFGAMILQFAAHLAVIKLSKWIIGQISEICSDKAPPKVTEFYNLEPATISLSQPQGSVTVSRSLSYVSSLNDEP